MAGIIWLFVIAFSILLRSFYVVPRSFIASFFVGQGAALMLAGLIYTSSFICPKDL